MSFRYHVYCELFRMTDAGLVSVRRRRPGVGSYSQNNKVRIRCPRSKSVFRTAKLPDARDPARVGGVLDPPTRQAGAACEE